MAVLERGIKSMARLYDGDIFEHKGRKYRISIQPDDTNDPPWERDCGHGIISEEKRHPFGHGTKPSKAPGERILYWERGEYRTYDVAGTLKIAKRDGWGLAPAEEAALAQSLGRAPTAKEIIAKAVDNDFERLRGWFNDEWEYVGVIVRNVGNPAEGESLWGIESDCEDYIVETAHELADEIAFRLDTAMACEIQAARPDMTPS